MKRGYSDINPETGNSANSSVKKTKYNPYIHGTNSSILTLLPKTQFNLTDPLTMVEKYHAAPLFGEINRGGLDNPFGSCNICFGKIDTDAVYNLKQILSYAMGEHGTSRPSSPKFDLNKELIAGPNHNFNNINLLLIYLIRNKQLDIQYKLEKIPLRLNLFSLESLDLTPKEHFELALQIHYLYLILGKYLFINIDKIKNEKRVFFTAQCFSSYFNLNRLKEIIYTHHLNLKDIYENPTNEKLKSLLDSLELPADYVKEQKLNCTQFFSLTNTHGTEAWTRADVIVSSLTSSEFLKDIKVDSRARKTYILTQDEVLCYDNFQNELIYLESHNVAVILAKLGYSPEKLLELDRGEYYYEENLSAEVLEIFSDNFSCHREITTFFPGNIGSVIKDLSLNRLCPNDIVKKESSQLEFIKTLDRKFKLFLDIAEQPNDQYKLNEDQLDLFKKAFPLVLVLEDESKVRLLEDDEKIGEYRAINSELKVGTDFPVIATDTLENQHKLLTYFHKHHQADVNVVNFNSLSSNQKPHSLLTHDDGAPKLRWLAYRNFSTVNTLPIDEALALKVGL
ncbi:MAG: hypothetical protein JSS07_00875 [Proteobacteria bacterium]|nr:hypothetical protein [Pseudomonadota bacterium]